MKLAILASGNLGLICLRYLFTQGHRIDVILTDNNSTAISRFAADHNIPVFNSNPRAGRAMSFLSKTIEHLDLIVSVNYLFIIDKELIHYPKIGAINFHGSLLPKYRGRTPHVWAIINNEIMTGVTAHLIDEKCDAGPIVEQLLVPISQSDTGGSILEKFNDLYPDFIHKVLTRVYQGQLMCKEQDHSLATYFGKRTPESGKIIWSWHRERIYNWVRAQAKPYPGAFCFSGDIKIIVDKIEFSNMGYCFEQPDGLVLSGGEQPVVKTPNGAIKIIETRCPYDCKTGEVLT